jgi:hypothetical protein
LCFLRFAAALRRSQATSIYRFYDAELLCCSESG